MSRTKRRILKTLGWAPLLIVISLPQRAAASIVLPAANNATVQPGGPRAGVNGKQFFNMEGSVNGTFASFGVVDFQSGPLNVPVISLILDLTQANAAFTHDGSLSFYLSTDTTTGIEPVSSPLAYNNADLPTGLGTQLSTLFLLGTASFTQVSDGSVNVFPLSLSPAAATYLSGQVMTGGLIRMVIASDDPTVAATYAGFTNAEVAGPDLTLVTPVLEPGHLECACLALLALAAGSRLRVVRASVEGAPEN